jgi:hypothetical protein
MSHMESSTIPAAPASAPVKDQSFWEDLIDIFFAPVGVFRRAQHKSPWPPLLFVVLAMGVILFFTFNAIEPVFDAEFARNTARAVAKAPAGTPQASPETLAKIGNYIKLGTRYGAAVAILVAVFLLGVVSWLLALAMGAKQSFHKAMVVASWSYMPRVLGAVLGGVQGLIMDPAQLTGAMAISLSPARFLDPDTSNQLLFQFLGRLDLITIWVTILLAVGLYCTTKISKGKAVAFGIFIWLLGSLPALRTGYLAS